MINLTSRKNSFLHLAAIAYGMLLASMGIGIFVVAESSLLLAAAFLLFLPAAALLSMGLCRIWKEFRPSLRVNLPGIPAILDREVSLAGALRFLNSSVTLPAARPEEPRVGYATRTSVNSGPAFFS